MPIAFDRQRERSACGADVPCLGSLFMHGGDAFDRKLGPSDITDAQIVHARPATVIVKYHGLSELTLEDPTSAFFWFEARPHVSQAAEPLFK